MKSDRERVMRIHCCLTETDFLFSFASFVLNLWTFVRTCIIMSVRIDSRVATASRARGVTIREVSNASTSTSTSSAIPRKLIQLELKLVHSILSNSNSQQDSA